MKRIIIFLVLLEVGFLNTNCQNGAINDSDTDTNELVKNSSFSENPIKSNSEWIKKNNGSSQTNVTYTWEQKGGINNTPCASITLNKIGIAELVQNVTGLTPGQMYYISAKVKGENVVSDGNRPVVIGIADTWYNSGENLKGTFSWRNVRFNFCADETGTMKIALKAGCWWNDMTGKVYFDDVVMEEAPQTVLKSSNNKVAVYLPNEFIRNGVNKDKAQIWMNHLGDVYDAYNELVGDVPDNGKVQNILGVVQDFGAWGWAGNPIIIRTDWLYNSIKSFENDNDWGFGVMHELGHNFNITNNSWNWNDELFANFRMYYAVEKLNGNVIIGEASGDYHSLKNYYSTKDGHDLMCYYFIEIAHKYGWDVFKNTFRKVRSIPQDNEKPNLPRFTEFISALSEELGSDVRNEFPDGYIAQWESKLK